MAAQGLLLVLSLAVAAVAQVQLGVLPQRYKLVMAVQEPHQVLLESLQLTRVAEAEAHTTQQLQTQQGVLV
jgi:hypothetical protein